MGRWARVDPPERPAAVLDHLAALDLDERGTPVADLLAQAYPTITTPGGGGSGAGEDGRPGCRAASSAGRWWRSPGEDEPGHPCDEPWIG
jgi:hypothetical protein